MPVYCVCLALNLTVANAEEIGTESQVIFAYLLHSMAVLLTRTERSFQLMDIQMPRRCQIS